MSFAPSSPSSPSSSAASGRVWLTYRQASEYTQLAVGSLRNLVSAGQIPVYGAPHSRRFRRDMLDLFLTDRDAAMRLFRHERSGPHDR